MKLERILVVKLADLGDVLLTEPAIRSLRRAYPLARIDVLTTPSAAPLVEMFALDLNVIVFRKHDFDSPGATGMARSSTHLLKFAAQLRSGNFDAVCLLHHLTTPAGAVKFRALAQATGARIVAGLDNGRGTFLTHRAPDLGFGTFHVSEDMLRVATSIGGQAVDPAPRLSEATWNDEPLPADPDGPYALMFPVTGPFAPGRNWRSDSFGELAGLLSRRGMQPVIAGASDATQAAHTILKHAPEAIDLTGRTSLLQLASVVSNSAVTITGDSFPGHLAAATGTPLVSIFGPSNHRAWAPYGATALDDLGNGNACIIRNDVPCSPCLYTGFRLGRRNGCSSRICLTQITPDDVLRGVDAVVGKRA